MIDYGMKETSYAVIVTLKCNGKRSTTIECDDSDWVSSLEH